MRLRPATHPGGPGAVTPGASVEPTPAEPAPVAGGLSPVVPALDAGRGYTGFTDPVDALMHGAGSSVRPSPPAAIRARVIRTGVHR